LVPFFDVGTGPIPRAIDPATSAWRLGADLEPSPGTDRDYQSTDLWQRQLILLSAGWL
jgi:hypothetical protein